MCGWVSRHVASILAILIGLYPASAGAGGITISQTTVVFRSGEDARTLTLLDPGAAAVRVQARLFRWHGGGTDDVYAPTRDIGFSPAIFTLEPGGAQVLRLVVLAPRAPRETAYRLFIDELPPPARAGSIALPIRLVLPVFVEGTRPADAPALAWSASRRNGLVTLTAVNTGGTRVRVSDLGYRDGERRRTIIAGLAGYVLAGEQRMWSFPFRGASLDIFAHTEQGDIRQSVPLAAP
jgi:fimbrial chaperone protein